MSSFDSWVRQVDADYERNRERRAVDRMGVHSYHGCSIGSKLRIRLPNDYNVIGVDHGKDDTTTAAEVRVGPETGKVEVLSMEEVTRDAVKIMTARIVEYVPLHDSSPFEILYGIRYPYGWKPSPPPTRWQKVKRRWSDRWNRVKDAWDVLRGTHFAVNKDEDRDDY